MRTLVAIAIALFAGLTIPSKGFANDAAKGLVEDAHEARSVSRAFQAGDYDTAVKDAFLLAANGNAVAQLVIGTAYRDGKGLPKNDEESARWYRLAAEQGLALAQYNLAVLYDQGKGVPEDHAESAKWARLAAEQGYSEAQLALAYKYRRGEGVPQDHLIAMMWLQLAVLQRSTTARFAHKKFVEELTPAERTRAGELVIACAKKKFKGC